MKTFRRSNSLILFLTGFILLASPSAFSQSQSFPEIEWPPYLTLQTDASITVNWRTKTPSRDALIVTQANMQREVIRILEKKPSLHHHITINNLVPGRTYAYQVKPADSNVSKTERIQFRMPFESDALTFFVISDTHQVLPVPGLNEYVQQRTNMVVQAMLKDTLVPDFFVSSGDHVEEDVLPNWSAYFRVMHPLTCKIPGFPVLGNHEDMAGADNYFEAFSFPDGGGRKGWEWYTFHLKNVLLIFLTMNFEDLDQINREIAWLKSVLHQNKDKTWKLVFTHQPLYSSSERYSAEMPYQTLFEPIFLKHGVDVVFSGHHHAYQRIQRKGIAHIVSAGGGGPLSELKTEKVKGTVATREKTLHYLRVRIAKNSFVSEVRIVGEENAREVMEPRDEIFDRFEIIK